MFFGLRYGYIPRGPTLKNEEGETFLSELQDLANKHKLIFTRIDPEKKAGNIKGSPSHSIQPETTLVLDLKLSEEALLKQMKRKGRYNIGLAEKRGVQVKMANGADEKKNFMHQFHELLKQTTLRDQFFAHSEKYYQKMLERVPESEVMLAFYQQKPVAGVIMTFQKERAIYYYGASGNEHREVMAPYLLQWRAIQEAKKRDCKVYDFLGIAPEGADKKHPWLGISSFKKKFGGTIVYYPQAKDIIHKPIWYKFYKMCKYIQRLIK